MRKKSHVAVQKWVDSVSVNDESVNCDNNELNSSEPSTSGISVKGRLTEICNKLNVNEKLKSKRNEFKNLLSKTSHKFKKEHSKDLTHQESQDMEHLESSKLIDSETSEVVASKDTGQLAEAEKEVHCQDIKNDNESENDSDELNVKVENVESETNTLNVQRCHISVLGRSSSENPNTTAKPRRLTDIGRSFSVAHDNEIPTSSYENVIYDADEDISLALPSLNTSPSVLSNTTNSNYQLDKNPSMLRPSLSHVRPLREHTVSEGHYSPHNLPKNPLLRDSSFQSDSSHCSSVESLLEARKPDAETILVNLGFGPAQGSEDLLTKIPKRFLKPSQCPGVDTNAFLKNQQLAMNIHENSVLGYRGLLGNPHTPPSDIVRAIMHRFSQNEIQRMASMENISSNNTQRSFKGVANTILAQRHFMK